MNQLKSLLEADPTDSFLTYALAMEYAKIGQPQQAIEWLNKTLTINADECYAYYQLGRAHHELGEIDQAREAIEKGIAKAQALNDGKAASELQELLISVTSED